MSRIVLAYGQQLTARRPRCVARSIEAVAFCFLLCMLFAAQSRASSIRAAESSTASSQSVSSFAAAVPNGAAVRPVSTPVTAYTLPPDLHVKARHLGRLEVFFYCLESIYGVLVLLLILRLQVAVHFRNWAEHATRFRFAQAFIFTPLFFLTLAVFDLPMRIYWHRLDLAYGLSIQRWGSWTWDLLKVEIVNWVIVSVAVWILYAILRRSPRRWWFYFWLALMPLTLAMVFLQPLVVDPLFHHFEPLARHDPALVRELENISQRAGISILPDRMFLMGASDKGTTLNAYVTGFGASKRIVVYDTTIGKMNTPQIATVFGHEMGHYVLNHIREGLLFAALLGFFILYFSYRVLNRVFASTASRWGIRAADDWASLPVLLLFLSLIGIFITPLASAFSRNIEHQADVYGLEVTHGLIPDSAQVTAQALQILGEVDLEDPAPGRFAKFWLYDHPWIGDRIVFALHYDPWDHGEHPRYVHGEVAMQPLQHSLSVPSPVY